MGAWSGKVSRYATVLKQALPVLRYRCGEYATQLLDLSGSRRYLRLYMLALALFEPRATGSAPMGIPSAPTAELLNATLPEPNRAIEELDATEIVGRRTVRKVMA